MGVEVDWRDVTVLVTSSTTISAFTCALVKFPADIGTEHQDFLKPTDGLFPSTGVMTKRIYDQRQEFDRDTPRYSVVILVPHNNSERKWDEIVGQGRTWLVKGRSRVLRIRVLSESKQAWRNHGMHERQTRTGGAGSG